MVRFLIVIVYFMYAKNNAIKSAVKRSHARAFVARASTCNLAEI